MKDALVIVKDNDALAATALDHAEEALMSLPQGEAPVRHIFGPGVYVREVTLKRNDSLGQLVIGHAHRHPHLCVMLGGLMVLRLPDGRVLELAGPNTFVSPPGRKVAVVFEDVVFQNIYATDETDPEALEERLLDRSPAFVDMEAMRFEFLAHARQQDREDFSAFLAEYGFSASQVRELSEHLDDQIPAPEGWSSKWALRKSPIEGRGVFAESPIAADEVIGPARIGTMRTPLGRYTNHARMPNAKMDRVGDDVLLVALRNINGRNGGMAGEEIVVDYRAALKVRSA